MTPTPPPNPMLFVALTVGAGPLSARIAPVAETDDKLSIEIDGAALGAGAQQSVHIYLSREQLGDLAALAEIAMQDVTGVQTLAYGLASMQGE